MTFDFDVPKFAKPPRQPKIPQEPTRKDIEAIAAWVEKMQKWRIDQENLIKKTYPASFDKEPD